MKTIRAHHFSVGIWAERTGESPGESDVTQKAQATLGSRGGRLRLWLAHQEKLRGRNSVWKGLRGRGGVLLSQEGKQEICSGEQRQGGCRAGRKQEGALPQRCLN